MIHGTHFQVSAVDTFPDGKMWGPWLWYLNDGSKADAEQRAREEFSAWPCKQHSVFFIAPFSPGNSRYTPVFLYS